MSDAVPRQTAVAAICDVLASLHENTLGLGVSCTERLDEDAIVARFAPANKKHENLRAVTLFTQENSVLYSGFSLSFVADKATLAYLHDRNPVIAFGRFGDCYNVSALWNACEKIVDDNYWNVVALSSHESLPDIVVDALQQSVEKARKKPRTQE